MSYRGGWNAWKTSGTVQFDPWGTWRPWGEPVVVKLQTSTGTGDIDGLWGS